MESIVDIATSKQDLLHFYSPYNFVRAIQSDNEFNNIILPELKKLSDTAFKCVIDGFQHFFLYENLDWDSTYFGINTIKLRYVLYDHQNITRLTLAIQQFQQFISTQQTYCFIEIPSEDINLIQALGNTQFKLIETRLTYFRGDLHLFKEPRFAVRKATTSDTENLKRVAREMRNSYDRFHADSIFSTEIADEFLATYIEQSINGFADIVLTPDETEAPSDSFLTARYLKNDWDNLQTNISKMILSAVSARTNKGWYKKLISEMTYHLHQQGAEYIFMNTQSTNRAVFYTWESLGYRLGCTTHVLSYNFS